MLSLNASFLVLIDRGAYLRDRTQKGEWLALILLISTLVSIEEGFLAPPKMEREREDRTLLLDRGL